MAKQYETIYTKYSGTIHVLLNVEGVHKTIPFHDVLFVPDLLHNLLLARRVKEMGMKMTFYYSEVLIHKAGR